ncbi:MAG: hypothetical protein A2W25_02410 [candidate division Zixibacteria bacterium RBG_16_53_22]|nr:MAG: hypothetical protein A2W25_02410 [candidate division Zixibacteria bacterium RBG_16_53_22]
MNDLVIAFSALEDMAIALGIAEKSVASVVRKFHAAWRNLVVLGFTSSGSILADARRIVKDAVGDAYVEGLKEGGVAFEDMDSDDDLMIIELTDQQTQYVTDFVKAVRAARGDKAAQRAILDRVELWTASIEAAGMQGLASAKKNEMVTWHYGDTEHCNTCQHLDGQRHRRSWFSQRNYFPRKPGAAMDCGGYKCQCVLE